MLQPEIRTIASKQLVGMRMPFSLAKNSPAELWRQFMPRRKEVKQTVNAALISMEVYNGGLDLDTFNEDTVFEKWAVVEVSDIDNLPKGMESYRLTGGKYAVFTHKAIEMPIQELFEYIFSTWLPTTGFSLRGNVHLEVMGEKYYGPNHPETEEDIWIPIK